MSGDGYKLFTNKPKKSKLKASTPITTASPRSKAAELPPPLPQKEPFFQRYRFLLPLESFAQRNRFLVPLVLVLNFTIGAYTLLRFTMRDKGTSEEDIPNCPNASTMSTFTASADAISEKPVTSPLTKPIRRAPILEEQQRELFEWMLEEKRKVKPLDGEEQKRVDEEKAILKQLIKARSIPSI